MAIVITVDPKGNTSLTVQGVAGPNCVKESAALEAAMGGGKDRKLTSEFHQKQQTQQQQVKR